LRRESDEGVSTNVAILLTTLSVLYYHRLSRQGTIGPSDLSFLPIF